MSLGPEVVFNDLQTTLSFNVGSSDISFTVATPAGLDLVAFLAGVGTTNTYRIRIGNELCQVRGSAIAGGGYSLSVARGSDGTTPAAHNAGSAVEFVSCRGGLQQLLLDRIQPGTYAGFRTAGTGSLLLPTDSPAIFVDDPATGKLHPWGPAFSLASSAGGVSISTTTNNPFGLSTRGISHLPTNATGGIPGSTAFIQGAAIQVPGQDGHGGQLSPYTITARILPDPWLFASGNTALGAVGWGIGWSYVDMVTSPGWATLEYVSDSAIHNGALTLQANTYSDGLTFSHNYFTYPLPNIEAARWLRLRDDGTFRYLYVSNNGTDFILLLKVARGDSMSFPITQAGVFLNTRANTPAGLGLTVAAWRTENI